VLNYAINSEVVIMLVRVTLENNLKWMAKESFYSDYSYLSLY